MILSGFGLLHNHNNSEFLSQTWFHDFISESSLSPCGLCAINYCLNSNCFELLPHYRYLKKKFPSKFSSVLRLKGNGLWKGITDTEAYFEVKDKSYYKNNSSGVRILYLEQWNKLVCLKQYEILGLLGACVIHFGML